MQNRSYDREEPVEHLEGPDPAGSGPSVFSAPSSALRRLVHDSANWHAAMLGQIDLLEQELGPSAGTRLKELRRSVEICAALGRTAVRGSGSEGSGSGTPPGPEPGDLDAGVRDALAAARARARSDGCTVAWETRIPSGISVAIDAASLANLLVNLLENARRALAGRGGRVALRAAVVAGAVELEVEDDGPGMDPETLRRCLERGFTTKGAGGEAGSRAQTVPEEPERDLPRGEGLAGVAATLEAVGGQIRLDSRIGHGTRVLLRLPMAGAGSPDPRPTATGASSATAVRVLVVEDEASVAEVLVEMSSSLGHSARSVGTVEAAERVLADAEIDVILLDQSLPDRLGTELANRVRQRSAAVAIVLLTGDGQAAERAVSQPAIDLVATKPLGLEELRDLLQRAYTLARSRAPRRDEASA